MYIIIEEYSKKNPNAPFPWEILIILVVLIIILSLIQSKMEK